MALLNVKSSLPKPLMLRDYLLDDLSSCSSNGFRSFPRRQCCTTVRFLLEPDLIKTRESSRTMSQFLITKSKSLQRASEAVMNAVKRLPFAAVKSPSTQIKPKRTLLPRSLSRKLMRRSVWKQKNEKQIVRWKSFRDFLFEEREPSDFSASTTTTTVAAVTSTESNRNSDFNRSLWKKGEKEIKRWKSFRDFLLKDRELSDFAAAATSTVAAESNSSKSGSNFNRNGWLESDFNSDYLQCSSGNSESSVRDDVVKGVSNRVGATVGEAEVTLTTKKEWTNEEKEQFSPVSVLDVPFDDEEDVSSPFQSTLVRMEGAKQKILNKINQIAQLDPVDLEKQFTCSEFNTESLKSPIKNKEEEEDKTEEKALKLLELMKVTSTIPSTSFKVEAENLLLEFFRERIIEECGNNCVLKDDNKLDWEVLNEAKDWINGQHHELLLDWGVQKNRETYLVDMEKGGRWRNLDEEREEVAMELEIEVLDSLVNELFLDLKSSS